MPSWMKNTPPRQVTTPCSLPSQPISDAVPSAPVKASEAGRTVKEQSYLLAGPLSGVGNDVPGPGAAVARSSGADPVSEPTATTRATAATTFIPPNMAVTLACRTALASRHPKLRPDVSLLLRPSGRLAQQVDHDGLAAEEAGLVAIRFVRGCIPPEPVGRRDEVIPCSVA